MIQCQDVPTAILFWLIFSHFTLIRTASLIRLKNETINARQGMSLSLSLRWKYKSIKSWYSKSWVLCVCVMKTFFCAIMEMISNGFNDKLSIRYLWAVRTMKLKKSHFPPISLRMHRIFVLRGGSSNFFDVRTIFKFILAKLESMFHHVP